MSDDGGDGRPLTLSELNHWLEFGGTCRRVSVGSDRAIVDLCTCTGELVERREAFEPPVLERLVSLRDQP